MVSGGRLRWSAAVSSGGLQQSPRDSSWCCGAAVETMAAPVVCSSPGVRAEEMAPVDEGRGWGVGKQDSSAA